MMPGQKLMIGGAFVAAAIGYLEAMPTNDHPALVDKLARMNAEIAIKLGLGSGDKRRRNGRSRAED